MERLPTLLRKEEEGVSSQIKSNIEERVKLPETVRARASTLEEHKLNKRRENIFVEGKCMGVEREREVVLFLLSCSCCL
jgi:hypothetical protein